MDAVVTSQVPISTSQVQQPAPVPIARQRPVPDTTKVGTDVIPLRIKTDKGEVVRYVSRVPINQQDYEQREIYKNIALEDINFVLMSHAENVLTGRQRAITNINDVYFQLTETQQTLIQIGLNAVLNQQAYDEIVRYENELIEAEKKKKRIRDKNYERHMQMIRHVCYATLGVFTTSLLIYHFPTFFEKVAITAFTGSKEILSSSVQAGKFVVGDIIGPVFMKIADAIWYLITTIENDAGFKFPGSIIP